MTCVAIMADKRSERFRTSVCSLIDANFAAVHTHGRKLRTAERNAEMIVVDAKGFDNIQASHTVLLYKDIVELEQEALPDRERVIVIVDAGNESLVSHVASLGLPAVTCGLSARDTVTLSSLRTDSAVISLQRAITALDGTPLEPQEIPVMTHRGTDPFALMSVAALCLLSGRMIVSGDKKQQKLPVINQNSETILVMQTQNE